MCDRSRWKPRAYCYSTKKIKSVAPTKWERQVPKEEEYWDKFCRQQKTKVIVRNSYPKSYSFIAHEYPLLSDYVIHNNNNAKNIHNSIKQFIHEKIPPVKSKFNIPSVRFESYTKENDINSVDEVVFPTVSISSPTPSETTTKIFRAREKELKEIFTKKISCGTKYSSQSCMNDQNAVSKDIRNRKIYIKENCPFHRDESLTRIFDDDIERYLVESNRKEQANMEKKVTRMDGKLLIKKTCRICQRNMNEYTSKSFTNLMDDIKLPDNLNSNQERSTHVLKYPTLNDIKNEYSLKSIENGLDDIQLLDNFNSNKDSLILVPEISKFNDLKPTSSKFVINDVIGLHSTLNSQMMTQEKNLSSVSKLSERKRKSVSKTKSDNLSARLLKCIKKRKESSTDSDFQKYFQRYAYRALKCVTPTKRLCFDSTEHETEKKIFPGLENHERGSAKLSTSSRSLISHDHELIDRLKDRSSLSGNFLKRLPKLSYFPRRTHDRCLSCLYKSVDKIMQSKMKDTYKITKRQTPMQNVSIDSDSSDITLPELKCNENQIDDYVKIIDHDVVTDQNETDLSNEIQKVEKETLEADKSLTDKSKETKERSTELNLGLENLIDKKIDLKPTTVLSEKSKISLSYSSSDEDKSSNVNIEDNSKTSKYRAPCHAPTILCPTLEPLKALKMRKSTPLQTRIALDEFPIENGINVQPTTLETKQQERLTSEKSKNETVPVKKLFTKVKSVSENLIAKSEDIPEKKERVLRRGSSCVNLETILRDFAKGTKLDSVIEDDSEKSLQPTFLFSTEEIEKVLSDLEQQNSSTINMLRTLCDMYLNRVLELNRIEKNQVEKMKRLIKLLIDSRRYLYPNKFPDELIFSSSKSLPTQQPLLNPERLRSILPLDSYNLIAPLLGMPEHHPRMPFALHEIYGSITPAWKHRSDKSDSSQETGDDLIVHPPSAMIDTIRHEELASTRFNPYALFLNKERRKVVTWRPLVEADLTGYDPEATLRMRADKATMKICRNFCKWLKSLGGAERGIDEEVLKDMFEISFSADACKATQISVKEMATVPTDVASARLCHGSSVLAMTRKQLHRDAEAESKPKRVLAFGTSMPTDLLFLPPNNRVHQKWLECKNVPRDLETMDTVWGGITNLDSVQGFVKWTKNFPEIGLPEALTRPTHSKLKSTYKKENDFRDPKNEIKNGELEDQRAITQIA